MTQHPSDARTAPHPQPRAHPSPVPYRGVVGALAETATVRIPTVPPASDDPGSSPVVTRVGRRPGAGIPVAVVVVVALIAGARAAGWVETAPAAALALVSVATLAASWLATRDVGRLGLWLSLASAMMMAGALTDILPHVWHEAEEVGVPLLAPGLALVGGFVVLTLLTRGGHDHDHDPDPGADTDPPTGRHRSAAARRSAAVGVVGAAAALTLHRVIEGATLALTPSVPVVAALLVHSAGEGLALAALFAQAGRSVVPWLAIAVAGPAVGVVVATVAPLPEAVVPVLLALVAGVLLRIAVVGIRMAAARRRRGELSNRHIAIALAAAAAVGVLSVAGH